MQIQWLEASDAKAGTGSILLWLGEGSNFGLGEIYLAAGVGTHTVLHLIRASASLLSNVDLRNINVALDVVEIVVPRGKLRFKILEIGFE